MSGMDDHEYVVLFAQAESCDINRDGSLGRLKKELKKQRTSMRIYPTQVLVLICVLCAQVQVARNDKIHCQRKWRELSGK